MKFNEKQVEIDSAAESFIRQHSTLATWKTAIQIGIAYHNVVTSTALIRIPMNNRTHTQLYVYTHTHRDSMMCTIKHLFIHTCMRAYILTRWQHSHSYSRSANFFLPYGRHTRSRQIAVSKKNVAEREMQRDRKGSETTVVHACGSTGEAQGERDTSMYVTLTAQYHSRIFQTHMQASIRTHTLIRSVQYRKTP